MARELSGLVIWLAAGGRPGDNLVPVLLALWALAMGSQSAAVRQLNVGGIFTTAATATVIFLVGDWANNQPLTSEEHNRLRRVFVSLAIGAAAGALLLLHAPIYAPMFPLVLTALVVAIAASGSRLTGGSHLRRRSAGIPVMTGESSAGRDPRAPSRIAV